MDMSCSLKRSLLILGLLVWCAPLVAAAPASHYPAQVQPDNSKTNQDQLGTYRGPAEDERFRP